MSMPAAITPQPVNATLSKRPELEYNKFETVAEPSKRFSTLSTTRNGVGAGDLLVSPPPPVDEGPSPFVQEGVQRKHLKSATVTYLDGTKHAFYVHKNSEGEILFDMVAFQLNLNEKDYFGLFFTNQDTMHWLYKDKKIFKQLKNLPWNFFFAVKFYPTHPSQLAEDLTRYLLFQQLRQDVHNEKLPVSFVSQAKLGSLAAQAEFGDFEASSEYLSYLKNAKIARTVSEPLLEKVEELHKQNKGQTSPEAELNYLNECKDLALYGVWLFQAKDSKGKPVQIGVSAQGISVYNDQMRIHRFAWVNIIKFSYRRNAFTIKLKPGEMDKKDTSVTYKLGDYPSAKRLWKSAVEHHTFFRLIQPEAKQKTSLLSFGSNKFRYQGRTNIQSHMASQLFDGTGAAVERADSVRLTSKSADNITPKVPKEHTSPLHYADDGSRDFANSPEKSSHITSTTNKSEVGDYFNAASTTAATALTVVTENISSLVTKTTTYTPNASSNNKRLNYSPLSSSESPNLYSECATHNVTQLTLNDSGYCASSTCPTDSSFCMPCSPSTSHRLILSDFASPKKINAFATNIPTNPLHSPSDQNSSASSYASASQKEVHFNEILTFASPEPRTRQSESYETSWNLISRVNLTSNDNQILSIQPKYVSNGIEEGVNQIKAFELPYMPIENYVSLYSNGIYNNKYLEEKNNLGFTRAYIGRINAIRTYFPEKIQVSEKIKRQNILFDGTLEYLNRKQELNLYPIRYFVDVYHSGYSVDPQKYAYKRFNGTEDVIKNINLKNYVFSKTPIFTYERLERDSEIETCALPYYCHKYKHYPSKKYNVKDENKKYSAVIFTKNEKVQDKNMFDFNQKGSLIYIEEGVNEKIPFNLKKIAEASYKSKIKDENIKTLNEVNEGLAYENLPCCSKLVIDSAYESEFEDADLCNRRKAILHLRKKSLSGSSQKIHDSNVKKKDLPKKNLGKLNDDLTIQTEKTYIQRSENVERFNKKQLNNAVKLQHCWQVKDVHFKSEINDDKAINTILLTNIGNTAVNICNKENTKRHAKIFLNSPKSEHFYEIIYKDVKNENPLIMPIAKEDLGDLKITDIETKVLEDTFMKHDISTKKLISQLFLKNTHPLVSDESNILQNNLLNNSLTRDKFLLSEDLSHYKSKNKDYNILGNLKSKAILHLKLPVSPTYKEIIGSKKHDTVNLHEQLHNKFRDVNYEQEKLFNKEIKCMNKNEVTAKLHLKQRTCEKENTLTKFYLVNKLEKDDSSEYYKKAENKLSKIKIPFNKVNMNLLNKSSNELVYTDLNPESTSKKCKVEKKLIKSKATLHTKPIEFIKDFDNTIINTKDQHRINIKEKLIKKVEPNLEDTNEHVKLKAILHLKKSLNLEAIATENLIIFEKYAEDFTNSILKCSLSEVKTNNKPNALLYLKRKRLYEKKFTNSMKPNLKNRSKMVRSHSIPISTDTQCYTDLVQLITLKEALKEGPIHEYINAYKILPHRSDYIDRKELITWKEALKEEPICNYEKRYKLSKESSARINARQRSRTAALILHNKAKQIFGNDPLKLKRNLTISGSTTYSGTLKKDIRGTYIKNDYNVFSIDENFEKSKPRKDSKKNAVLYLKNKEKYIKREYKLSDTINPNLVVRVLNKVEELPFNPLNNFVNMYYTENSNKKQENLFIKHRASIYFKNKKQGYLFDEVRAVYSKEEKTLNRISEIPINSIISNLDNKGLPRKLRASIYFKNKTNFCLPNEENLKFLKDEIRLLKKAYELPMYSIISFVNVYHNGQSIFNENVPKEKLCKKSTANLVLKSQLVEDILKKQCNIQEDPAQISSNKEVFKKEVRNEKQKKILNLKSARTYYILNEKKSMKGIELSKASCKLERKSKDNKFAIKINKEEIKSIKPLQQKSNVILHINRQITHKNKEEALNKLLIEHVLNEPSNIEKSNFEMKQEVDLHLKSSIEKEDTKLVKKRFINVLELKEKEISASKKDQKKRDLTSKKVALVHLNTNFYDCKSIGNKEAKNLDEKSQRNVKKLSNSMELYTVDVSRKNLSIKKTATLYLKTINTENKLELINPTNHFPYNIIGCYKQEINEIQPLNTLKISNINLEGDEIKEQDNMSKYINDERTIQQLVTKSQKASLNLKNIPKNSLNEFENIPFIKVTEPEINPQKNAKNLANKLLKKQEAILFLKKYESFPNEELSSKVTENKEITTTFKSLINDNEDSCKKLFKKSSIILHFKNPVIYSKLHEKSIEVKLTATQQNNFFEGTQKKPIAILHLKKPYIYSNLLQNVENLKENDVEEQYKKNMPIINLDLPDFDLSSNLDLPGETISLFETKPKTILNFNQTDSLEETQKKSTAILYFKQAYLFADKSSILKAKKKSNTLKSEEVLKIDHDHLNQIFPKKPIAILYLNKPSNYYDTFKNNSNYFYPIASVSTLENNNISTLITSTNLKSRAETNLNIFMQKNNTYDFICEAFLINRNICFAPNFRNEHDKIGLKFLPQSLYEKVYSSEASLSLREVRNSTNINESEEEYEEEALQSNYPLTPKNSLNKEGSQETENSWTGNKKTRKSYMAKFHRTKKFGKFSKHNYFKHKPVFKKEEPTKSQKLNPDPISRIESKMITQEDSIDVRPKKNLKNLKIFRSNSSILKTIRLQFLQHVTKSKSTKKEKKNLGHENDSSSSSSSSSSDVEVVVKEGKQRKEKTHHIQNVDLPTSKNLPLKKEQLSAGPYIPANDPNDGQVIREERVEQIYRITGSGNDKVPSVDPLDASLAGTISKCIRENENAPNVKMVEEQIVVRENGIPVPQSIKESSLPRKTVHSWEESSAGPETVTTEVDEDGNIVKRTTVKSEQVKHTVQMQSYQTYALGDDQNSTMPMPAPRTLATSSSSNNGTELNGSSAITSPTTETRIRTMAYEHGDGDVKPLVASIGLNGDSEDPERGQLVSTKAVTTGNRTVETLTYKKEKDGVIETHVEHRITIHSGEEIDHDAELSRAILEATNMNPEMTVEKVELKHERQ